MALPGDEDIGGLDVPMDDTLAVGGIERSVISMASASSAAVSSRRLPIRCVSVTPSRNPDRPLKSPQRHLVVYALSFGVPAPSSERIFANTYAGGELF